MSGERIRQARLRAGMSQEDLAHKVGVSARNVVRWETGRTRPRVVHLLRIAEVCGVPVTALLDDGDDGEEEESELPLTRAEFAILTDLIRKVVAA